MLGLNSGGFIRHLIIDTTLGSKTKVSFVSTNSIVQGEQMSILWSQMLNRYNIKIHFAHRTFKWSNEASGNAAVYCVIIGFANYDTNNKSIFDYEDIRGEAQEIKVRNINPYLVDAKNILINKRTTSICKVAGLGSVYGLKLLILQSCDPLNF